LERETWPDRPDTWAATTKLPLRDASGRVIGLWGISRDVTDRVMAEHELAERKVQLETLEQELRDLLDGSPDAIVRLDLNLRHLYANPAAQATFGVSAQDMIGRTNREIGRPPEFDVWEAAIRHVLDTGLAASLEFTDTVDGQPRWHEARVVPEFDVARAVTGALAFVRDLTARKQAEEVLAFQAVHDPLTGLANRVLFLDRVEHALSRLERDDGLVAVLFIDLDRFKIVNDTFGHAAGDWLLLQVAERIRHAVRSVDTVARFGGDEFVVLCEASATADDVRVTAERIGRALSDAFVYEGNDLHIAGGIGVATTADPSTDAERLVADAEAAMYQAKQRGGARHQIFDAGLRTMDLLGSSVELELRAALDREEFTLHYQPLQALANGKFLGVEALLRWQHPTRGLLAPAEFLDAAERSNLIVDIGVWAINEACRQLAEWKAAMRGGVPFTVSVNVSGRQFSSPHLADVVSQALSRHGVAPGALCLEVSEIALLEESATAGETLARLTAIGVQIALDDFGTGYSTIAHLRRFPIDIIKIDRSFIGRLTDGAPDSAIVAAFTAMAHALGITTVGEGIETLDQLDLLQGMGVDEGQGYLFSRPVPAGEILQLLRQQQAHAPSGPAVRYSLRRTGRGTLAQLPGRSHGWADWVLEETRFRWLLSRSTSHVSKMMRRWLRSPSSRWASSNRVISRPICSIG
jgi:diguanylate cyclase (GGDEF)-like protein/PAS domain S-box-containing protein